MFYDAQALSIDHSDFIVKVTDQIFSPTHVSYCSFKGLDLCFDIKTLIVYMISYKQHGEVFEDIKSYFHAGIAQPFTVHNCVLSHKHESIIMYTSCIEWRWVAFSFIRTRKFSRVYELEALWLDLTHGYVFFFFFFIFVLKFKRVTHVWKLENVIIKM